MMYIFDSKNKRQRNINEAKKKRIQEVEKEQDKILNEREFVVLYERIKNIILDPLSIWKL